MPLSGVFVSNDDRTLAILADGRNECAVSTTPALQVSEGVGEVRIEASERQLSTTAATGPVSCALTGGPRQVELQTVLSQPLGTRTIVDGSKGSPIMAVRAVELLAPVPIPDGWRASDRSFSGTADGASWSIGLGPSTPGIFYGVSIAMAWGTRCEQLQTEDAGAPPAPPTTVRGREATVGYGQVSVLSWVEGTSCVQLIGYSACTPVDGCRSVDPNQLAALAETLVAGAWP